MKIRIATTADADAVLEIYAPVVRDTVISFELTVPSISEMEQRITRTLDRFPWLIAEVNGRVAGYAYAGLHRSRLAYQWSVETSVYVSPDFRRQGVARKLYGCLFALLRGQGFINAYAGVGLPNPGSENLHSSSGFKEIGVYKNIGFKFGAWHSVRWYELALSDHPDSEPPAPVRLRELDESFVAECLSDPDGTEA